MNRDIQPVYVTQSDSLKVMPSLKDILDSTH